MGANRRLQRMLKKCGESLHEKMADKTPLPISSKTLIGKIRNFASPKVKQNTAKVLLGKLLGK